MFLKTLQSMQPDRVRVGAVKTFKCTKRFRIVSESCVVDHNAAVFAGERDSAGRGLIVRPSSKWPPGLATIE
ncbi:hypothetical protein AOA61_14675 [Pseudomonas sp. 2995-1]|nr:hypothetical protein AOA61_14675 [Pseudomonas sp. 2995-1]